MIPVQIHPQPLRFKEIVEIPGDRFLDDIPKPTTKQWKSHAYWTKG